MEVSGWVSNKAAAAQLSVFVQYQIIKQERKKDKPWVVSDSINHSLYKPSQQSNNDKTHGGWKQRDRSRSFCFGTKHFLFERKKER